MIRGYCEHFSYLKWIYEFHKRLCARLYYEIVDKWEKEHYWHTVTQSTHTQAQHTISVYGLSLN